MKPIRCTNWVLLPGSITVLVLLTVVSGQACLWAGAGGEYTIANGESATFTVRVTGENLTTGYPLTWKYNDDWLAILWYSPGAGFEELRSNSRVTTSYSRYSSYIDQRLIISSVGESDDGAQITVVSGGCSSNAVSPTITLQIASDDTTSIVPTTADVDVDECNQSTFPCSDSEICVNTIGAYYCECIDGYTASLDGCIQLMCPRVDVPCSQQDSLISLCASAMNGVTSVTFDSAVAGYTAASETKCGSNTPNVNTALGSRVCQADGTWGSATWLGSCATGLTVVATEAIETEEQREQVAASLQILTTNIEQLTVNDLSVTSEAITNITSSASSISATTATSVISTISNILQSPALTSSNRTSTFLAQLDTVASLVELQSSQQFKAVSNNVALLVTSSNASDGDVTMIMVVRPDTAVHGFRSDQFTLSNTSASSGTVVDGQRVQASINVPREAIGASKLSVNAIGNRDNQFPTSHNVILPPNADQEDIVSLTTLIISATIDNESIFNFPPGAVVQYSLPASHGSAPQDSKCVFWNESTDSWSDKGCRLAGSTVNALTCSCDHLTNFAALLRPRPDAEDPPEPTPLDIVTIVGCSLSTFALLILVMLFLCVPKTRSGRKFQGSFLLLNLSIALLGLNLTILISEMPFIAYADHYDAISTSCQTLAVFLHIFLLASCAWMNCEGVMLFLAVVKPLYTRAYLTDKTVILFSTAWGWIMPIIFVVITAVVDFSIYIYPHADGFAVTCWINPDYVVYLAVAPMAIMIGGNLIIYIILSYRLCGKRKSDWGSTWRASRESYQRKIGINVSILVLLGVTWIFGFFLPGIEDETIALPFAYIFTIFNSLQGVFLMMLYVMRNKDVRFMFSREMSTLYSNKIGFSNTVSKDSKRTGRLDLSASIEDSSSSTSNPKSSKNAYLSDIVETSPSVGTHSIVLEI